MAETSGDNRLKALPPSAYTPSDCSLFVPVARQYQPEPAALEQLVGVLYELLTDVAITEPVTATTLPQPTCFSAAPE